MSASKPSAPLAALRRLFLRAYAPVAMCVGLGTLALMCLCWAPLAWLALQLPLSQRLQRRLGRGVLHHGARGYLLVLRALCMVRIDTRALHALREQSPLILVANHPSLLDAVLIMASLPRTVCVMKRSLQSHPLYGAASRLAHYVGNGSPMEMVRAAHLELQHGGQLLIFPEGTRTTRWPVNRCDGMCALMAQRARAPLQVIYIHMSTPYLGKRWALWRPPELPLHCTLRLGPRLDAAGRRPSATAARIQAEMRDHFAATCPANHDA